MNKYTKDEYQDAYLKAWQAQNKIDAKSNKMVFSQDQRLIHAQCDPIIGKKNGKLGGRPKAEQKVKLTERAKLVNRMIKRNMTMREIGEILGVSHQSVSELKRRYGLPRDE